MLGDPVRRGVEISPFPPGMSPDNARPGRGWQRWRMLIWWAYAWSIAGLGPDPQPALARHAEQQAPRERRCLHPARGRGLPVERPAAAPLGGAQLLLRDPPPRKGGAGGRRP